MKTLKAFLKIFALPILLFFTHLLLLNFKLYIIVPWLDMLMHLLGGSFIAFSFYLMLKYFEKKVLIPQLHYLFKIAFILSFVATATVLWEFGEFISDSLLKTTSQVGLEDTLLDMFLGLVGGVAFVIWMLPTFFKLET